MSTFAFRAIDVAGIASAGELEAPTKSQVAEQLRNRGLIVLDVSEKRGPVNIEDYFNRFRGISMRELAVMSRQFATLVASGMPMLRSLTTLQEQTQDKQIDAAIIGVRADVEAGSSLASAMERHPNVFDKLYRSMVRSGEESGRLEDALDRVAFQIEKLDALRRQVRSAMMYPAFVFTFALLVMIATVVFIVPVFVGIFNDLAEENGTDPTLPLPTRITMGTSDAVTGYWFVIIPAIGLLAFAFFQWKKTDRGRRRWDAFKLRIPARVGDVIHKVALARWSRTFSGAIASGVPILHAIRVTGQTTGNAVVEDAMDDVYNSVKGGGSIAGPIADNPVFPAMVSHMVAVGEETGQLEHMLGKIADFYEDEVDAKIKALTSLIEPLMICFVGGVVGFIVISMYLPIFSIYDKIR